MADFPPAQYIDGYTATGDTISFTIAGYTGKKVASVTVTNGGSYTTPTASVAFSGGSGSGAVGECLLELKSLDFGSTGATSLISTSQPNAVQISMSGNSSASPLYGLQSLSATGDHYYNINTPPTISVSGENGTSTDAVISFDSTSSLHVASLVTPTPATGGGIYPMDTDTPVQIVDASNTSVVLGTATISANGNGNIDGATVNVGSWTTPESRATLLSKTLKLKTTVPSITITSFTQPQLYINVQNAQNGVAPSISVPTTTTFANGTATFEVTISSIKPITFYDPNNPTQTFVAGTGGYSGASWLGSWDGDIYDQNLTQYQTASPVATISSGSSTCSWTGTLLAYANAGNSFWMRRLYGGNYETFELKVRTASVENSTPITLTNAGRYSTSPSISATNLYTNSACSTLLNNSSLSLSTSTTNLSSASFAIKAVRMAQSTASSRVTVTQAGDGYAELLAVAPSGLYANTNLDDVVISNNFTQTLILKSATINKNDGTYSAQPTITVSGGGINDSSVTKSFKYNVKSVSVTLGGTGYTTSPSVAITGSVSSGGANATATSALSATPAISLPNLTGTEADSTTGDFREICHALCELIETIDTTCVKTDFTTTLQTSGVGVMERFTFQFDLLPEAGALAIDPEP